MASPLIMKNSYSDSIRMTLFFLLDGTLTSLSQCLAGLQIISGLTPVKLSGQTYFCSDISYFWPDKHWLRLIAVKVPSAPFTWCLNMKQVNFQSIYCSWAPISMNEKSNTWYSKISITFVRTTAGSVLLLIYN